MLITRRNLLLGSFFLMGTGSVSAATGDSLPEVAAYRQPGCGCCENWAQRMTAAGFVVKMSDDADLAALRAKLGVPGELAGCHVALIGPHVFEGHVPPDDIKRFLTEAPQALGLAVPGMPTGSPGMENGGESDPFDVILFDKAGSRSVYARH